MKRSSAGMAALIILASWAGAAETRNSIRALAAAARGGASWAEAHGNILRLWIRSRQSAAEK